MFGVPSNQWGWDVFTRRVPVHSRTKWIKFALIEGKKEHKKNIGLSSQSHQTNTEHARQSRGRTTGNLFVMIDISSHD